MNRCTRSISLFLMGSALGLAGCHSKAPDPNDCIEPDPGEGDWGEPSTTPKQPGQACYNSQYRGNSTHYRGHSTTVYRGGRTTIVPVPVPVPARSSPPPPIPSGAKPSMGGTASHPTGGTASHSSTGGTARGGFGSTGHSASAHS